uniref:ENTH domain-containing protein n=1 Tax=Globodera pallida TaxID=36090 RepID=A0A183CLD9_GLOPA
MSSISTLRRQVKNVACNFTDAQVKVREATSNDPWGPTTVLMSEIADLTHNPVSFTEIMSMVWKRLNDHGKNWRHVYKSMVLLDYLIKCGSEKVSAQCRENLFSIETLKDEEKLKNERARFMLTRKRFIQNGSSGIASDGSRRTVGRRHIETGPSDPEFEEARPSSLGEEEMQLQIALALSKEECEKEQELRRGDDIRLQIAIEESKRVVERSSSLSSPTRGVDSTERQGTSKSHGALDDLLSLGDIFKSSVPTAAAAGSSSQTHQQQPQITTPFNDPWSPRPSTTIPTVGTAPPFSSVRQTSQNFSTTRPKKHFSDDLFGNVEPTGMANSSTNAAQQRANTKTPESFLGENSVLVNLDNLLGPSNNTQIVPKSAEATNPFLVGSSATVVASNKNNPFLTNERPSPSLNEMLQAKNGGGSY